MVKVKTKELIVCLLAVSILILAIATNVFATDINALVNDANNNNDGYTEIENTVNGNGNINVNNNAKNNSTVGSTNKIANNTNTNKTTTIPYTGIDYSVVVIIAICGVSAVYAYKKIRDYNV